MIVFIYSEIILATIILVLLSDIFFQIFQNNIILKFFLNKRNKITMTTINNFTLSITKFQLVFSELRKTFIETFILYSLFLQYYICDKKILLITR